MQATSTALTCVLAALMCASCSTPAPGVVLRSEPGPLESLTWMVGSWSGPYDDRSIEEHWSPARAGMMLGTNRTIAFGRVVHFEFLQIEATDDGIFYRAWPQAQPPASFRLTDASRSRAVFANPNHDYPSRIIYWREGHNLHARIEGTQNGTKRTATWLWKRAAVELQ
jgi:hypothetical protein